jgi:superfamily I DNA/RNA helicase
MTPRFVAGPPGTGKTHKFIVKLYKDLLNKYSPENIIILSHTNVAADEIRDAILELPEMKERGLRKKFFKYRICTIHKYCRSKVPHKEKFDEVTDHANLVALNRHFFSTEKNLEKHGFYKYVKAARGKGLTLEQFWRKCIPTDYKPYNNIKLLTELYEVYINYKKEYNICDFEDMVEEFTQIAKDPQIDALIIDEAQDSNVPQLKAINKMARNVKDEHYYMVGDADQTIFEFSGSDAEYFHKLSANPFEELEEGKRCSVAVNKKCKQIIKPIWDKYGYSRVWTAAKYTDRHGYPEKIGQFIYGNEYYLPNLNGCSHLSILLNKIHNTNETFLFTFRGTPSDTKIRRFFIENAIEFSHIDSSPFVSKKELRAHYLWKDFLNGKPMSLTQIKEFWEYLSGKIKIFGKGEVSKFDDWIKQDYTVDQLIEKKYLKNDCKQHRDFDLIRKRVDKHDMRMRYIKDVLRKGVDFNKNIRVKYGNIHTIKGLTFDNVVVDLTMTRKEDYEVQLRLKYTAYSRAIYDYWTLASEGRWELGKR